MVNDFKNSFWGLVVVFTGLPAYWYWSRKRKAHRARHKNDIGTLAESSE